MNEDIRWRQMFSNYRKALQKFNQAVDVIKFNEADNEYKGKKNGY